MINPHRTPCIAWTTLSTENGARSVLSSAINLPTVGFHIPQVVLLQTDAFSWALYMLSSLVLCAHSPSASRSLEWWIRHWPLAGSGPCGPTMDDRIIVGSGASGMHSLCGGP